MCGICGIASAAAVDRADLLRMTETLRHRGPDDDGVYVSPSNRIGLGFRRLSIRSEEHHV